MRNFVTYIFACLLLCPLLVGCGGGANGPFDEEPVVVEYAQGFKLSQGEGYRRIDIVNPWKEGKILNTYILVDKSASLPERLPQGTLLRTPLAGTVVSSSVHCELLDELGCIDAIGGVCDSRYIYNEELRRRIQQGRVADAGNSTMPNVERIVDLDPDAVLLSSFENNSNERIDKMGIPIIECCDYMETTPLGRVEWVRVFGWLYGCETVADSLFDAVCDEYTQVCALVDSTSHRPMVITERRTGSVWYMPGGNSYMAALLDDAGAYYPWQDDTQSGSIPLSFESVFDKGADAEFWLIKYNNPLGLTYRDIEKEHSLNKQFKPFINRKIYGCNTHDIRYYEETPFHPEKLLIDLVAIFHPEIFPHYAPRYFSPLAQ